MMNPGRGIEEYGQRDRLLKGMAAEHKKTAAREAVQALDAARPVTGPDVVSGDDESE